MTRQANNATQIGKTSEQCNSNRQDKRTPATVIKLMINKLRVRWDTSLSRGQDVLGTCVLYAMIARNRSRLARSGSGGSQASTGL